MFVRILFFVILFLMSGQSQAGSSDWAGYVFGLAFLLIGIIYIAPPLLSILLGYFVKQKLLHKGFGNNASIAIGILAALTFLSIPFWDYPYKKSLIQDYCEKEGGLHVSRMVTGVEGVLNLPFPYSNGYQYYEGYIVDSDKTSLHRVYSTKASPTRLDIKENTPISAYGFRKARSHVVSSIYRVVLQTYVIATGEELGRYVYFESYAPTDSNVSLINGLRFWMRMSCPKPNTNNRNTDYYSPELLQSTLQPAEVFNKGKFILDGKPYIPQPPTVNVSIAPSIKPIPIAVFKMGDSLETVKAKIQIHGIKDAQLNLNKPSQPLMSFPENGIRMFFDSNNHLEIIRLDAPYQDKVMGIGIGDSLLKLKSTLGEPIQPTWDFGGAHAYLYSDNEQLSNRFDVLNEKVTSIFIFRKSF